MCLFVHSEPASSLDQTQTKNISTLSVSQSATDILPRAISSPLKTQPQDNVSNIETVKTEKKRPGWKRPKLEDHSDSSQESTVKQSDSVVQKSSKSIPSVPDIVTKSAREKEMEIPLSAGNKEETESSSRKRVSEDKPVSSR